jgi:hypothetical protein
MNWVILEIWDIVATPRLSGADGPDLSHKSPAPFSVIRWAGFPSRPEWVLRFPT